jgi:hypothetical protein
MIDRRAWLTGVAALACAPSARAAGRPGGDLEGVWTSASYTDLQRPKELPNLVLTPAEAEAYEAPRRAFRGMLPSPDGTIGQAENENVDRGEGLARVKGQIRSSWIVDPPDGQVPFTPWALAQGFDKLPPPQSVEDPEGRTGPERCLGSANGGAPMIGAPDANLFQIVQTRDAVAIHSEKYHDARIVRLWTGRRPAPLPPSWMGDSTGRWEGATLVVETDRLRPGVLNRGFMLVVSGETQVTERFTRLSPRELFYEFTISDPRLFTRPWSAEMTLTATDHRIYEYACHEGNYSLPGILRGARVEEAEAARR